VSRRLSRNQKILSSIGVAAVLGGIFTLSIGTSQAGESCQALDTALRNNLQFIAGQQQSPDANSAARIANRQAVVDLIQQRRQAAGCKGNGGGAGGVAVQPGSGESCAGLDTALRNNLQFIDGQRKNPDANSAARIANRQAVVDLIQQRRQAAGCTGDAPPAEAPPAEAPPAEAPPAAAPPAEAPPAADAGDQGAPAGGEVVCPGSTVTLSGEAGAPAASSGAFPVGTKLRVTNLDNNKSVTVTVTSGSGSCVLLNNAAFEQVREPNKFLIRRAVIQRVG